MLERVSRRPRRSLGTRFFSSQLSATNAALTWLIALWLALLVPSTARAQSYSVLYSFQCTPDGKQPAGNLIADTAGNLYGTTPYGGQFDWGTVFRLDANGVETVLYSFTGGSDGSVPQGGVVRDAAGNLYGTASTGGCTSSECGAGTVFKLDPAGADTTLLAFTGGGNGGFPVYSLLLGPKGSLYGITSQGGFYGNGIVFELQQSGQETVLHNFPGGAYPSSGVISDAAGHLYGTTSDGGSFGYGTVYKVNKAGGETVLYSFAGEPDGAAPVAGLTMDTKGDLYGVTVLGGQFGYGTVFKLDPKGVETVLYSFTGGTDGGDPYSSLVMDPRGNLYGTAELGGLSSPSCTAGCGVVFELTAAGKEKVLHSFTGAPDGEGLQGEGLVFHSGAMYGITYYGGAYGGSNGCGTVYKVTP